MFIDHDQGFHFSSFRSLMFPFVLKDLGIKIRLCGYKHRAPNGAQILFLNDARLSPAARPANFHLLCSLGLWFGEALL